MSTAIGRLQSPSGQISRSTALSYPDSTMQLSHSMTSAHWPTIYPMPLEEQIRQDQLSLRAIAQPVRSRLSLRASCRLRAKMSHSCSCLAVLTRHLIDLPPNTLRDQPSDYRITSKPLRRCQLRRAGATPRPC